VFGTQSVAYISSSQLNIGTNIITVNTDTPSIRFGGLAVYDSGSTGLTGSMLWDSEDNQWIYSNPSGSTYDSAVFLVGPRNSGVLGNEPGISCNFLSKGNGMHHMTSSAIFENGSVTCIPTAIIGGSTACFGGNVTISGGNDLVFRDASNYISSPATDTLRIVTANSERLRITSTGIACFACQVCVPNIISTGASGGRYGTFNAPTNGGYITFEAGGTAFGDLGSYCAQYGTGDATTLLLQSRTGYALALGTNSTEKVRIDTTGNLMVGSLSAGNAGTINVSVGCAGTTAGGLQLWATTAQTHYVQFGDGTAGAGPYAGYVGYAHSTDTLLLGAGAATRAIITSAGVACFSSTVCMANTIFSTAGTATLVNTNITSTACFGATSRAGFTGIADNCNGVYFGMGADGTGISAGIGFFRESSGWNSALAFYTNCITDGVTVPRIQEKMRITSCGNVGIGNTSPLAKLDILGNTDTYAGMAKIYLTDSNTNSNSRNWSIGNGGSAYGNLTFSVSAAKNGNAGDGTSINAMVINNTGNVGIGTISPCAVLHVQGTAALQDLLYFCTGASVNTKFVYNIASGADDAFILRRNHTTQGNLCIMSWTYNGYVGIGATAPSSLLHICGAGTGAMLRLQNTSTVSGDQGPMIQFMSANQVGGQNFESGYIQSVWTSEGNGFAMRFATKGVDASQAERMRITTGGQVQIGCGVNASFYNGPGCRYNFTNLNTPQDLVGICANNGLIVIRDHTAGGTGVFLIDPNQGVICVASNIPATVSIAWNGSLWRWCLTSGGVPRCLGYGFYGA
jgi:hypothetical protein